MRERTRAVSSGRKFPTGGMRIIPADQVVYLPNGQPKLEVYFGLVKCRVTAPGPGYQSQFPILPMR
jgi:hypothetical protein